eukprot:1139022-Pelagomonas_calceolata.AAC.2
MEDHHSVIHAQQLVYGCMLEYLWFARVMNNHSSGAMVHGGMEDPVMNNRSSGAMVHGGMEDPRVMREDVSASGNLDLVIGRLFAGAPVLVAHKEGSRQLFDC